MPFRLEPHEHPGRGLKRLYGQEAGAAIAECRAADAALAPRVHEVRKHLKKMRAILKLLREEIGHREFKSENFRLGDAGRQLSPVRDAEVRLATFEKQREAIAELRGDFPRVRRRLAREARAQSVGAGPVLEGVVAVLQTAHRHAGAWKVAGFTTGDFSSALQSSYKTARDAYRAARREMTVERQHDLRKRLKDFCSQLEMARPLHPDGFEKEIGAAKILADLLGQHLDLAVLREALIQARWKAETALERDSLLGLLAAGQLALEEKVLTECDPFFREGPKAFRDRLSLLVHPRK